MTTCTCSTPKRPISLMERPNPLPEITSEHLCAQCASLDLNALLQSDGSWIYRPPWLKNTVGSACPLCRFLATAASVKYPSPDPDTEIEYDLQSRSFSEAFARLCTDGRPDMPLGAFNFLGVHTDGSFNPDCCMLPVGQTSQNPERPTLREIDTVSIDFAIVRSWFLHCRTHHSAFCAPLNQAVLQEIPDLKLIDCQTRQVVKAPRNASYVALSYVWGKSHATEVTVLNQSSLPETVPRTIEDAIQVVLRLDLKYLWVDKYCIDQSSDTELAQQIPIMDMIYNSAFCTIVAACGEDASFGLPGVGSTRRREQPAIRLNGQVWVSSLGDPDLRLGTSTWASRAWTYQEGLFSRRHLIFTEEQVYFECTRIRCLEAVSCDLHCLEHKLKGPQAGIFNGSFGHKALGGLDKHIEIYTKRSLSFQKDILNALSGVLRLYSRMPTPTRNFWGVPMDYNLQQYSCWPANSAVIKSRSEDRFEGYIDAVFARGLCWHLEMPSPRRPGFPSWSWSGWIGPLPGFAWGRLNEFGDSEVKIWLQRADGEYERLSESVIDSIGKCGPTYMGYTPLLRIEAWVFDTNLTYLANGSTGVNIYLQGQGRDSIPRHSVSIEAPSAPWFGGYHGTIRWSVVLSVQAEEGGELYQKLCRETLTCVLLSKASRFGLVVCRRAEGIMERIGHVETYPSYFDSEGPFDFTEKDTEDYWANRELNMFDVLPPARRTILLG